MCTLFAVQKEAPSGLNDFGITYILVSHNICSLAVSCCHVRARRWVQATEIIMYVSDRHTELCSI